MDWKGGDSFLVPRAPNIPYFRYIVHKMSLHQLIDMIASIEPAQQPRENGCTAEISLRLREVPSRKCQTLKAKMERQIKQNNKAQGDCKIQCAVNTANLHYHRCLAASFPG